MKVPITKPVLGDAELRAVQGPIESGWVVQGPAVAEFERRFGEYTGTQHNVATTSCTTALHLAVAALGLAHGDEVLVPAFTWVSTPNVVEYMGATPRFVDVDLATFNVAPDALDPAVTDRTVGIMPVHLFGLCADMTAVGPVAARHGLWTVEDAACAFGAWQGGRHAGTLGDIGAFSFHPRKSITTGEGGMLTTANADWAHVSRSLRDHGGDRSDLDRHHARMSFLLADYPRLGFNYRMTDIQGAIGCAQLDRADWIMGERRRQARRYDEALGGLDWLDVPSVPAENVHGYQAYVCLYRPEEPTLQASRALHERRNALMLTLEDRGIATRQGTHAPVTQTYYREKYGLAEEDFPNAVIAERLSLTLPLYPAMTEDEQDFVIEELVRAHEAG
jgi:dTDP-4-amino-4,6-dideoxygalactose transaminase